MEWQFLSALRPSPKDKRMTKVDIMATRQALGLTLQSAWRPMLSHSSPGAASGCGSRTIMSWMFRPLAAGKHTSAVSAMSFSLSGLRAGARAGG